MNRTIRIGTRDSELALWQAKTVQNKLESFGYSTQLVPVKSTGDLVLNKPLYEMGITGIFTKTLDIAMLENKVDIAVHSMKDVPTSLPKGIIQTAVLEREIETDLFLHGNDSNLNLPSATIATGSLRRKAQWLHKYPNHTITDLRGNVNSRLDKLNNSTWAGAIFATAGLKRLNLIPENHTVLDWMIPAPAQGAMVVVALEDDLFSIDATQKLNHKPSEITTTVERIFLKTLEGGCTAPIGALATQHNDKVTLKGALFSLDGTQKIEVSLAAPIAEYKSLGTIAANTILEKGGKALMKAIKEETQL